MKLAKWRAYWQGTGLDRKCFQDYSEEDCKRRRDLLPGVIQFYQKNVMPIVYWVTKTLRPVLMAKISSAGVIVGLMLALPLLAVAALEALLVSKVMETDSHAFVQQAIGDTTLILASHFKAEFAGLSDQLTALGRVAKQRLPLGTYDSFDFDSVFLDLEVFNRGDRAGVFDQGQESKKTVWALNSKYARFSEDFIKQVQQADPAEKAQIKQSFQGLGVFAISSEQLGKRGVAFITQSFGSDEVIAAHVRLDFFQSILHKEAMLSSFLVDGQGVILVHPDPQWIGLKADALPLYQIMKNSKVSGGQSNYTDPQGNVMLGGYQKVGFSSVAVLANISEREATAALTGMRRQLAIFLTASFVLLFSLGYALAQRFGLHPELRKGRWYFGFPNLVLPNAAPPTPRVSPGRYVVTIVHGSLRQATSLLEKLSPDEGIELVNEFFDLASGLVVRRGGVFEKLSGTSFVAFFGLLPESSSTENKGKSHAAQALRTALELRLGLQEFNKSRKVEGRGPIFASMGVETGSVLAGNMGGKTKTISIIGDSTRCAKTLNRLTDQVKTDVLVSTETWKLVEHEFLGDVAGEAQLTQLSGLRSYYSVRGYLNIEGKEVLSEGPFYPEGLESEDKQETHTIAISNSKTEPPTRWTVNNGSQILGPLNAEDISQRLFAQELDFDCECWAEGTGNSAIIKTAGIFLGSDDQDAALWAYDGKIIQGPFSPGFLKTALLHGALPFSISVCRESTINGWLPLEAYPELTTSKETPGPLPSENPPKTAA